MKNLHFYNSKLNLEERKLEYKRLRHDAEY